MTPKQPDTPQEGRHTYVACEGRCKNLGCHYVQGHGDPCGLPASDPIHSQAQPAEGEAQSYYDSTEVRESGYYDRAVGQPYDASPQPTREERGRETRHDAPDDCDGDTYMDGNAVRSCRPGSEHYKRHFPPPAPTQEERVQPFNVCDPSFDCFDGTQPCVKPPCHRRPALPQEGEARKIGGRDAAQMLKLLDDCIDGSILSLEAKRIMVRRAFSTPSGGEAAREAKTPGTILHTCKHADDPSWGIAPHEYQHAVEGMLAAEARKKKLREAAEGLLSACLAITKGEASRGVLKLLTPQLDALSAALAPDDEKGE